MKYTAELTMNIKPNLITRGLGFFILLLLVFSCNSLAFADTTSNLTGYWNFDDSTADDCSQVNSGGNCDGSNPGTLTNGASIISPGEIGNGALSVSYSISENQYVNVPDNSSLDLPEDFTISAWINMASFGANNSGIIVDKSVSNGGYSFSVNNNWDPTTQSNSPKALSFQFAGGSSVTSINNAINTGTWYHVAFTRQGTTGIFYVNGYAKGTYTVSSANNTQAVPLQIGAFFNGKIDEVRAYNGRALTVHEILALCGSNSACAPNTFPPVLTLIQSGNVTSNSATITWTTDEPANSQVNYGTSTGYGDVNNVDSVLGSGLGTSHSVVLIGLAPATIYHYQIVTKDASNNTAISVDYTFTTASSTNSTAVTQSMFYTTPGLYDGYYSYPYQYYIAQPYAGSYLTADQLTGIDPSDLVIDNTFFGGADGTATSYAANEYAIDLSASKGNSIPFDFINIKQGVYFMRIVGRVNDANIPRFVKPLILDFSINDGPNGQVDVYKVKVLYSNYVEETGRIFFNQLQLFNSSNNTNTTLHGVLSVDPSSQEDLLVHRIDFFDALQGASIQKTKTAPTTYTAVEQAYIQANPPSNLSTLPTIPASLQPGTDPTYTADRLARDQTLWNDLPLINSMHTGDGDEGTLTSWPGGLTQSQYYAQYGQWTLPQRDPTRPYDADYDYDLPWVLTNSVTGLTYSMSDYIAHRPLPDNTPSDPNVCRDAGFGCYFNDSNGNPTYQFIIPYAIFDRMELQYSGAIYGQGSDGGAGLPYRYYVCGASTTGNCTGQGGLTTARDASLDLVRFALQWPALEMEAQGVGYNSANPDPTFGGSFRWTQARPGKIYYTGWTGPLAEGYAQAYDYLYSYICGPPDSNGHCTNTEFANAVHGFVPWVNTPDDVISLIDTYLLQTTYNDSTTNRIELDNPMLIGLVMQNGTNAQTLMDLSKIQNDIDPLGITDLKRHYHTSMGQDGTTLIGSLNYTMGESDTFINSADPIARFKANGGTVPYDLTNLAQYPKVKAYADTFSNILVAGGYMSPFGDSGNGIDNVRHSGQDLYVPPTEFEDMWKYGGNNPKVAWFLVNEIGRTIQLDDEWIAITAAAATVPYDPRLTSDSRVFNGLGLGILESGLVNSSGNADTSYQDKSAVVVRTSTGEGHAHFDALDLAWYGIGLRMGTPYGTRNDSALTQSVPADDASFSHNMVEVDGYDHPLNYITDSASGTTWPPGSFENAEAWVDSFAPNDDLSSVPGATTRYISAEGLSGDHPNVSVFRRDDSLIDIDASHAYVFDVFRVGGGQLHTWCFHGADTDNENGGMTVNTAMSTSIDSNTAHYLRKFAIGTYSQGVAPSSGPLQVTWQLGRSATTNNMNNGDGTSMTVTTVPAEPTMLGPDYNSNNPRKYTKISMFDRAGDKVMSGNEYSGYYQINEPNILVQSGVNGVDLSDSPNAENITESTPNTFPFDPNGNKQDVYPVIIEAYSGSSLITSSSSLTSTITPNDNTALKAVALTATMTNGNTDIMYSDGENNTTRTVNGSMTINARSGYYSTKNGNFRMMNIVGGTQLTNGSYSLQPSLGVVSSTIQSVDYVNQKIYTTTPIPVNLINRDFRIFNSTHHTAYTITSIANSGSGSVLTYSKAADYGQISVDSMSVNSQSKTILTSAQSWDLSYVPNRNQGLTGTNEAGTVVFKISKASANSGETNNILSNSSSGQAVVQSDFTDTDGDGTIEAYIYDFGFGDTIQVDSNVTLTSTGSNTYILMAPVDTSLTIPGSGNIQVSSDNINWTSLPTSLSNAAVTATVSASSSVQYIKVAATLTSITFGDVNGDGRVTIYDAELTAQKAIGLTVANFNISNAEVDGTGRVDIYDAFLIAEYAVGLINKFPVQQ